ncbi:uncharacterized protein BJ171DRAFT_599794 [Polychytrium aggregatum]|uniref:uncharacterized protein n=1 Tax=Polychytrium aggregatum TaxID=110093 RepID=UPI0022FDEE4B|nr:uncharacterized protein BJ171DRAFT_599794 [Polychytrium aggregatum]KAI9203899.1 hypothetical protein BJ171DRAFT_599794 [Polychytrium aggregatum]
MHRLAHGWIGLLLGISTVHSHVGSSSPAIQTVDYSQLVNITISDDLIQIPAEHQTMMGIQAEFGTPIDYSSVGTFPLIAIDSGACYPFNIDLPAISTQKAIRWVALVERGSCSFEVKVWNLQNAGFSGVLIYDRMAIHPSGNMNGLRGLIRMKSLGIAEEIHIWSAFLSHYQGTILREAYTAVRLLGESDAFLIVSISLGLRPEWVHENLYQLNPLTHGVYDLLINLLFEFLMSTWIMTFLFGLGLLCRNMYYYRRLAFYVSSDVVPPVTVELTSLGIPVKVLTEQDLGLAAEQANGASAPPDAASAPATKVSSPGGFCTVVQDSCVICMDDFECGNHVRRLPCHHMFHDQCISEWLTRHTRLCPICKQDIIKLCESIGDKCGGDSADSGTIPFSAMYSSSSAPNQYIPSEVRRLLSRPTFMGKNHGAAIRKWYAGVFFFFDPAKMLSPFGKACFSGDLEQVHAALSAEPSPSLNRKESFLDFSYISLAVLGHTKAPAPGHAAVVQLLIEKGCSVDLPDASGKTAVFLASTKNLDLEMIDILAQSNANLNHRDKTGSTPLLEAIKLGNTESIRYLLAHGAGLDVADADNVSPRSLLDSVPEPVQAVLQEFA